MDQPAASDRFEELLAHRAWVRRVARALVLDESRADDLEQETWIRALGAPAPRSPRAWLGTVLRNTAVNLRLAESRRSAHEAAVPLPPGEATPAELLERAEVVERVARAVRTLGEPYRTAILLRYFEDLSVAAIAGRLGVPLETARTRLRRALVLLREQLDGEHRGDRRRWLLLLLPLARRPEPAATGSALAAGTAGAILVTLKTKVAIAAVLLLLGAGAVLWRLPAGRGGGVSLPPSPARQTVPAARSQGGVGEVSKEVGPGTPAAGLAAVPAANSGASIVGRVVDGETGLPVRGARVSLIYRFARLDPAKEPSATTDGDGRIRMEGIGRDWLGTDSLLVLADGYAEALHHAYGWRERIQGKEPVDIGEVRLERGAAVAGRVLTVDGRPVPGAAVLFCRDTPVTSPASFALNLAQRVGTTDSAGRFSLDRVPSAGMPFRHTLFAIAEAGFGWLALPPVAGRKDLADQDIRLAPTACIEVTVRDPGGRPVEGAKVTAEPHFPPLGAQRRGEAAHNLLIGEPSLQAIFMGTTDSSGRVRLERLPVDGASCRYDLVAQAGGFARSWTDGAEVTPGGTIQVSVTMSQARTAIFSGTIRATGGGPVAGAEVNFVGRRVRTDAEGAFRVEGIDPADLNFDPWVTVTADGYATAKRVYERPAPWDQGGNDFVLEPAVPVKGRVVDEAGNPVEGAQVTLKLGDFGVETGHSGADGRFTLKAAAGQEATLFLNPPQPYTDWQVPDAVRVPGDGSEVQIVLRKAPPGARVVAEVLDAGTGRPVDPTEAMLIAVDWQSMPRTFGTGPKFESGRVTFDRAFPGDWVLWVAAEGRAPAQVPIHVDRGQEEVKARVLCGSPGSVRGRLEGLPEGGSRRRMVFLSLVGVTSKPQWVRLQSDPKLSDAAWVETDGTFRIEGVPPGRLRIWTEFEGFKGETEVEVLAGTEVNAVVPLVAQGRATFRPAVIPPLPAVLVRMASGGGEWGRWSYFATRDGSIPEWTSNVPPGRIRWQARFADRSDGVVPDGPAVAEGNFEAKVGETVVVPIPVR